VSFDDALAAINAGLVQPPPNGGAAPAPAPPQSSIDRSLSILQGALSQPAQNPAPAASNAPSSPPQRPIGAAASMGEGVMDTLAAGVQGTSPVVGTATGQANYQPASDQDQWTFRETGQVPNQQTQVALRNPATGQYQVYQRNPAMAEGAAPAVGRMLALGVPEGGIPNVADQTLSRTQALLQDFQRSGVAPNIPTIAQGPASGYAASIMSKLPGFAGPIVRGTQNMAAQTGNAAERIASGMGQAVNPEEAGEAAQQGIASFAKAPAPAGMTAGDIIASPTRASSFAAKSGALYDRFWSQMDPNAQIPLTNTMAALQGPSNRFPTIPQLGGQITNPKLASLYQTVSPKMTTIPPMISSIVDQSGNPIVMQAAQKIQSGGTLTVPELQEFRSFIGRSLSDPMLVNDIPRADLSRVYAGMSQDLGNAAQAQGPSAARAFQAANNYYKAGQQRIDQIEPLLSGSPEQTFAKINRAAGQGASANAGLLTSLQRSMPPDDWGNVGAAVMRRMGEPTPGAKDVVHGSDFSPASFVTNWNKLSDSAKDTLFGAEGTAQRDNIEALTRVAGAQKNATRFANLSGTAHMGAVGAEAGIGSSLMFEHGEELLHHPIATVMALAGGYAAPRMLMSPAAAQWLYRLPSVINSGNTPAQGVQRALGALDTIARTDPALVPVAGNLRTALSPNGQNQ